MIKKTKILSADNTESFGSVNGVISKVIISNPGDTNAFITIKTDNIIIYNTEIPAKSSIIEDIEIIFNDESIYGETDANNINVILSVIELN